MKVKYDLFMEHWSCPAFVLLKKAVKAVAVNED